MIKKPSRWIEIEPKGTWSNGALYASARIVCPDCGREPEALRSETMGHGFPQISLKWEKTRCCPNCGSDMTVEECPAVVPIEANSPHDVFEAMCWRCGGRWIAVVPTETKLKDLECPNCCKQGYAFKTGQDIAEDNDGNT